MKKRILYTVLTTHRKEQLKKLSSSPIPNLQQQQPTYMIATYLSCNSHKKPQIQQRKKQHPLLNKANILYYYYIMYPEIKKRKVIIITGIYDERRNFIQILKISLRSFNEIERIFTCYTQNYNSNNNYCV